MVVPGTKEVQASCAFIDQLRIKTGGITDEDRKFLQERPHLLETINSLRSQLGASTKILSQNLYNTAARFIYELIQNAEDNNYTKSPNPPHVSPTLRQDRIIIDSNEDGFSRGNIEAICAVGKSTKQFSEGYIGEKGIGFKSVFTVANRVHIQSGPHSFAFNYDPQDKNDGGLGMVTPLNQEHDKSIPNDVGTRLILYLKEECDREALYKEFTDLPETLLLFLKKLKRLSIDISIPSLESRKLEFSLQQTLSSTPHNFVTIQKRDGASVSDQKYFIKKRNVTNMPAVPARQNIESAEVVLAFPVEKFHTPIIEDQNTFAFLPLRKFGFKFMIQSDFITQANREDVCDDGSSNSQWNQRLLSEVVRTFFHALEDSHGFLQYRSMKYNWVRYLTTTPIIQGFWERLRQRLHSEICNRKLFYARGIDRTLHHASHLRIISPLFRDDQGNPLLSQEGVQGNYDISENYDGKLDLPILKTLGVQDLSHWDFLQRLQQDLATDSSRMKSKSTTAQWHDKMATVLSKSISTKRCKDLLVRLEIVPLATGRWARPLKASIFWPTSAGVNIPSDLGLAMVSSTALEIDSRKKLFQSLGVEEYGPADVFKMIESRYKAVFGVNQIHHSEHIKFLFGHHGELNANDCLIPLLTHEGKLYNTSNNLPGDMAFGTANGNMYCSEARGQYALLTLLNGRTPPKLEGKIHWPHPDYYEALKECTLNGGISGEEWFRSRFRLHTLPCLRTRETTDKNFPKMSPELQYIISDLPHYLLGVLAACWSQYPSSKGWIAAIQEAKVPILESLEMRELKSSFLPLPRLKHIVSSMALEKDFGFLKELAGMTDADASRWNFLSTFGVGLEENVDFWLALYQQLCHPNNVKIDDIFTIYRRLQTFVSADDVQTIQITRYQPLYCLFVETLHLRNATLDDFLQYLEHIQKEEAYVQDIKEERRITAIYRTLSDIKPELPTPSPGNSSRIVGTLVLQAEAQIDSIEKIRNHFERAKLIYYPPNRSWHAPSDCVWADDTVSLPHKVSLSTAYKGLTSFFHKTLAIPKPSLDMHILALCQKALENPEKSRILEEMRNICALQPTEVLLRSKLSDSKFLPIRNCAGDLTWASASSTYAIIDRREYGTVFAGKICLLDFTLEAVHSLRPFLSALGLQCRYLSALVKEETKVQEGLLDQYFTNDLRQKAYAICRYAVHFGSADPVSTYDLLQNLEVYTSDGISKVVSITQLGPPISVSVSTAYCHLSSTDNQMKVYIPRNLNNQHISLCRTLPTLLLKHFGIEDTKTGAQLGAIITARSLVNVDCILEEDGIIDVPGVVREQTDQESDSSNDANLVDINVFTPERPSTTGYNSSGRGYFASPGSEPRRSSSTSNDPFLTPATSVSSHSPLPPDRQDLYGKLIDMVIKQADRVEGLPKKGDLRATSLETELGFTSERALYSAVQGEYKFKTGAAGELFVYEILSRLELPGFSLDNWQSTIRHRVNVHDKYRDLVRWSGRETADIVYRDEANKLTAMLISKGYLSREKWVDRTPTYYLEVKTTTGPLEQPFFCSQNQYDRMEKLELSEDRIDGEIYLIVRVFSSGETRMGLKLYLDPATLRKKHELTFVSDRYAVTPLREVDRYL
ncbi:hypothetical protein BT63DRAFT_481662 [Microthyrium microscopicum]|uniref:Protein NO VEIN C-terminal domain-containing protein n=1 Tax=Microthyrium microscopicum TaxID=703497 RepID=A0A6A6U7E8_9PEZI|nr:hypothetical protein BT63DRAFT_481662 [Microthyrium microscopicum]